MKIRAALAAILLLAAFVTVASPASAHEADCSGSTQFDVHVHDPTGHPENDTVVFCGGLDEVPEP